MKRKCLADTKQHSLGVKTHCCFNPQKAGLKIIAPDSIGNSFPNQLPATALFALRAGKDFFNDVFGACNQTAGCTTIPDDPCA